MPQKPSPPESPQTTGIPAVTDRPCGRLSAALFALLLCMPAAARAEDGGRYAQPGIYLRGGVSLGFENFDRLSRLNDELAAAPAPAPSPGARVARHCLLGTFVGFDAALGYRATPRLAFEAQLEGQWASRYVEVVDVSSPDRPVRITERRDSLQSWTLGLNGKLFALTGRVQPFALLGVGAMYATPLAADGRLGSAVGLVGRFGGGADFHATEHVAVDVAASYLLATGSLEGEDRTTLSISIQYRF